MTEHVVTPSGAVSFAPKSVADEVLQNVSTILATPQGSVMLDRDFGLPTDAVDAPPAIARVQLTAAITKQIARYEPRAKIKRIEFKEDHLNAHLVPMVTIEVTA